MWMNLEVDAQGCASASRAAGVTSTLILEHRIQILSSAKLKYNINDETLTLVYGQSCNFCNHRRAMSTMSRWFNTRKEQISKEKLQIQLQVQSFKEDQRNLHRGGSIFPWFGVLVRPRMCQRHFAPEGKNEQRHVAEDVGLYIGKNECIST